MTVKIKVLFFLLLMSVLTLVMYKSVEIKDLSIREVYEDVTFMRITIEAKRYVSQIEYGIKNGRQLDNFYNMQETLKGIRECSSYMEGAYIVSAEGELLYQSGLEAERMSLAIPANRTYLEGKLYTENEDTDYFHLAIPIRDGSGHIDGYLIMSIGKNAVNNAVSDYNRQNSLQSAVILLEILGIALFVIKRIRPNENKKIAFRLILLVSIAVISAAVLDSGIVFARFYQIVDDTARQSANKMAQALQSDVDSIIAKGVSTERIYDLNGWLTKNSSELPIVTSLTLDKNHKITAIVSKTYVNSFFRKLLVRTFLLVLSCVICAFAACETVRLFQKTKMRNKKFNETRGIAHA